MSTLKTNYKTILCLSLVEIRYSLGVNILNLSNLLDISQATYSRYESGEVQFSPNLMSSMMREFNIRPGLVYIIADYICRVCDDNAYIAIDYDNNVTSNDDNLLIAKNRSLRTKESTHRAISMNSLSESLFPLLSTYLSDVKRLKIPSGKLSPPDIIWKYAPTSHLFDLAFIALNNDKQFSKRDITVKSTSGVIDPITTI